MKKKILIGLVVVILLGVGIGLYFFKKENVSRIFIDINPSLELSVNKKGEVKEVRALNEDGILLLEGLNLVGMDIEEATLVITEEAVKMNYIDEFSIDNVISIKTTEKDLEEKIKNKINTSLEAKEILFEFKGFTDEMRAEADKYDVSYGNYLIMEKAIALNPELRIEDLATMKMKEIQEEIQKSLDKQNKTRIEERKQQRLEEKEARKEQLEKRLYDRYLEDNQNEETKKSRAEIGKELLDNYKKRNAGKYYPIES
ncbi:MAG: hypothetical protein PHO63_02920 [Bacilli bacterium]|nr:hypothetical protein [Bacilli bacterium]MDD4808899.1 hypothetical protein [Bacilli bacterium]